MRIAYLDCFAGIAGDMFLGALLDAGVPVEVLHSATAALNLDASLRVETVDRSGISCTKVHVLEGGELAEGKAHSHSHAHGEEHSHAHTESGLAEQEHRTHSHQIKTQHQHKTGHAHGHDHKHDDAGHKHEEADLKHEEAHGKHGEHGKHEHGKGGKHGHEHGRSLTEIRALIAAAPLHEAVKSLSIRTFELLGRSEAKIHNVPVEEIHFHEVGAVDAIVDIVASCAGIHHLKIGAWYASAVNVGGGTVDCAHGTFPVPAPATADLLREVPTYSAHVQKELVTPTGAALLRALSPTFGPQPAMRVEHIGYGAGTRDPKDFPNVLRLSVGVGEAAMQDASATEVGSFSQKAEETQGDAKVVAVLETALDDASPQLLAYVAEMALAAGALDVMLTSVIMKKGRPGTLLTLLCRPESSAEFQAMLLRETPTLGLRIRQERRVCLERTQVPVETRYGSIRVKVGSAGAEERNAAPEFEDCRAAAKAHNVPLKLVQEAALAAYRATQA